MKKAMVLFLLIMTLSGCATYKFHHGQAPYDKGYVVSRDGYTITEYTLGKDNSVPGLASARERFRKRRRIVEHYYKKMGHIENHFKMAFWDPCIAGVKLIGGVFRLPSIIISDYRSSHNPKYREKIRKIEDQKDAQEEERIQGLKEKLGIYVQNELTREDR